MYDIAKPLANKFLSDNCQINPNNKPTDAWSQYNTIRKVNCGIRDTITYKPYNKGGSGNAAVELVYKMTGINKQGGFVCRDYADLYEFLMRLMNIQADKVNSKDHEWNTF